jgi:glycosyltransferase involved in cell wall biosynthesis
MKVLWVHNFNPRHPGSGSFMYTFARGLSCFGLQVELLYIGGLRDPSELFRARSLVQKKSRKYDIVHSQFGSACSLVSSVAECRRVLSLRGSDWHRYRGANFREALHSSVATLFTRHSVPYHDLVISVSDRIAREVVRSFPTKQVEVIPDPIDLKSFRIHSRESVRRRVFRTEDKSPWVLFTTLDVNNPVKRAHLAVEAVRIASAKVPGLQLKVASGISHDKMPLFVASCNLVLCTSTHEGWPNSVKEALACGLPFVATDVSDLSGVASRHSSCIISPPDAEYLAEMIVKSLNTPPDQTLRDEVKEMSLDSSCRRLANLYRDLLDRQSAIM